MLLGFIPESVFAADTYTFTFPGELKLGIGTNSLGNEKYVDHIFSFTQNGTKHTYKTRWSQYVTGTFDEVSPGNLSNVESKNVWLYKISDAWLDGAADPQLTKAIMSTYYMISKPVTSSSGTGTNTQRRIMDIAYLKCQGTGIEPSFLDWNGQKDCVENNLVRPGETEGMTVLRPTGMEKSNWVLYLKHAAGGTDGFYGPYLNKWADWVLANTPIISEPKLPQAAVDACKSSLIQPQSTQNWSLMGEVKTLSQSVAEADNQTSVNYDKIFNSKFYDAAKDKELYQIFYEENANYSNKHLTKGDQLDQLMNSELAEINSWSEADIVDSHLKFGKFDVTNALYVIAGADIATNSVLGLKAGGYAAKAGMNKVAATTITKIAAKKGAALPLMQVATREGAAAVAGANAARTAGMLASKANLYTLAFSIAVTGVAIGTNVYFNSQNDEFNKAKFQSLLADYYISKHLEFHDCILNLTGATKPSDDILQATGFTQEVFDSETSVLSQLASETASDMAGTGSGADSMEICGCDTSGSGLVSKMLKGIICTIICTLYEWGYAFAKGGAALLNTALGTTRK